MGSDVLAVADYYGSAVRLYTFVESENYNAYTACGHVGCKARRSLAVQECSKGNLCRPSGLAIASSGVDSSGCPWAVLLVAETGAQCVSVFRLYVSQESQDPSGSALFAEHLSDLGVEQLGSGMHAPHLGQWGWMGVATAENGDVLVTDCDNDVLYIL
ncbi:hypothetical protein AB1Y20_015099 [Prymnesium parvum]|uniref:Cleavage/polyadenylation specificity factor A subunit C-terminal domain-containing protein n=1 Tax=Prymnesium parvum TaxID=97485 RepID=A0AB34JWS6_PRYPA